MTKDELRARIKELEAELIATKKQLADDKQALVDALSDGEDLRARTETPGF